MYQPGVTSNVTNLSVNNASATNSDVVHCIGVKKAFKSRYHDGIFRFVWISKTIS